MVNKIYFFILLTGIALQAMGPEGLNPKTSDSAKTSPATSSDSIRLGGGPISNIHIFNLEDLLIVRKTLNSSGQQDAEKQQLLKKIQSLIDAKQENPDQQPTDKVALPTLLTQLDILQEIASSNQSKQDQDELVALIREKRKKADALEKDKMIAAYIKANLLEMRGPGNQEEEEEEVCEQPSELPEEHTTDPVKKRSHSQGDRPSRINLQSILACASRNTEDKPKSPPSKSPRTKSPRSPRNFFGLVGKSE